MRFVLPLRDFRWMEEGELADFDPLTHVTEGPGHGYILEVDLEYPPELHDKHNSYPLAPESLDITWDMLSNYSKSCLRVLQRGGGNLQGPEAGKHLQYQVTGTRGYIKKKQLGTCGFFFSRFVFCTKVLF